MDIKELVKNMEVVRQLEIELKESLAALPEKMQEDDGTKFLDPLEDTPVA